MLKRLDVADYPNDGLSHEEVADFDHFGSKMSTSDQNPSEVAAETISEEDALAEEEDTLESWFDTETKAFFTSMLVHVGLLVGLAAIPIVMNPDLFLNSHVYLIFYLYILLILLHIDLNCCFSWAFDIYIL